MEQPGLLDKYAILTIPGGFSYGDDISAGKILATQMIHHLSDALSRFIESGRLVLGICNGFQVLVKAGLLPGPLGNADNGLSASSRSRPAVTLTQNDSARFEDRWIRMKSGPKANAFLPANTILEMPMAHGEGKLVASDESVLRQIVEQERIALTYCDENGNPGPYPINPNGSELDIAGLIDGTGRVLGLMPHPERHVHPTQHPQWTRRTDATPDGRVIFESAVRACK